METKTGKNSLDCPSYVARPGAYLFGVIDKSGNVNYLKNKIRIDKNFVEETQKGRPPEERFRFSGPCIQHACNHWEGGKCSLIEKIIKLNQKPLPAVPQNCAIKNSCRWYAQENELACANCSEIFRNSEMMFLQNL